MTPLTVTNQRPEEPDIGIAAMRVLVRLRELTAVVVPAVAGYRRPIMVSHDIRLTQLMAGFNDTRHGPGAQFSLVSALLTRSLMADDGRALAAVGSAEHVHWLLDELCDSIADMLTACDRLHQQNAEAVSQQQLAWTQSMLRSVEVIGTMCCPLERRWDAKTWMEQQLDREQRELEKGRARFLWVMSQIRQGDWRQCRIVSESPIQLTGGGVRIQAAGGEEGAIEKK